MTAFAAGRHVFLQPAANLRLVHRPSTETIATLPIPPRPFEPKGCPDHPIQGDGFKFNAFSDVDDPDLREEGIGGSIHLIGIDPIAWWDTYELHAPSAARACSSSGSNTFEIAQGLDACVASAPTSERAFSSFTVLVEPRHYVGPLGQPLALYCGVTTQRGAQTTNCEISYRIAPDIGVWYQFNTAALPLTQLIGFDRELRRRVAESEIHDYWWAVLPNGRPEAR